MEQRKAELQQLVEDLLSEAERLGATAAEAAVSSNAGLSLTVRLGETETIEHTRDNGLGVTVYFGQRKGSASTSDLSPQAINETVEAACNFARYTSEDPCSGLADAELMASDNPDLDLYHPWRQNVEEALELAIRCEDAARDYDPRIVNSEGASLNSHDGLHVYGNTHGFMGGYPSSRHSLSCAVVGKQNESMQRDYWYTLSRQSKRLDTPEAVGRMAAERTLARLNARQLPTQQAPVLFQADVAVGLLRSFIGAIRGSALYRKASFLLDHLGKPVFPEFVTIHEEPRLARGLASAAYDNEGVATCNREFVRQGVLDSYVLDSYAARKLGMRTTGNAGGVRNLRINSGELDREGLLRTMDKGLIVTELMGQGVNMVTGDYSRGATGFWVEGGEIQYPVEEITIAGNMREMLMGLLEVGSDVETRSSIQTGSWLIDRMMIAGE
ncbi:MAG: metalloprotease PmbA [Candidatus Thiodiazotropha taylori]|nr:metalloprotease PmbA [Candidatus Thiodiazotropha taylori]MCW4225901.1 metalloprotease PmbA [Candidatus Thiodiazotropha endolucinida]MCG7880286.1 metalloprotease PmbA [Candidatus Thiodiazotropha taylori]MCG7887469.1 metalloprotease PmbA [Candidatus Thiodiazotropha taylori]MCG7890822.1 metalloprotease PmbA [Candidatus Thiodiazotropha taylori]